MPDFQANFDQLKKSNVIPDVEEAFLPQAVHDAIANLTDDEIAVLTNISKRTGSYIYLNKDHSVVCGSLRLGRGAPQPPRTVATVRLRSLRGRRPAGGKRSYFRISILEQVPITRVADLTALDVLQVPVFTSVTPMAKDLTTHLGKGMDKEAARVGAVMEAIERISAQELDGKLHQFTYSELTSCGANVADPLWFDLPRASSYRQDRKFEWVEGWELVSSRPIWILADLARSPATEQILDQVDTNGLAAGFTHSQALRSGILEVVERDAVSQHHFFHRFGQAGDRGPVGRRIDMTSLPPGPGALADRARNAGLELILEDLTTDLQIPVISSTLIDRAFPGVSGPMPLVAEGWGADLRAAAAATHAILRILPVTAWRHSWSPRFLQPDVVLSWWAARGLQPNVDTTRFLNDSRDGFARPEGRDRIRLGTAERRRTPTGHNY